MCATQTGNCVGFREMTKYPIRLVIVVAYDHDSKPQLKEVIPPLAYTQRERKREKKRKALQNALRLDTIVVM